MCNPNYLSLAIDEVLSLDLPEHLIPLALADQARLLAGFDSEADMQYEDWPLSSLQ